MYLPEIVATGPSVRRTRIIRAAFLGPATAGLIAIGMAPTARVTAPATAQDTPRTLPAPPANGVMGFVVESFYQPVVFDKAACPNGPQPRLRDAYLLTLPAAEAARLRLPENLKEWDSRWQSYAFAPNGADLCTMPDVFDHPMVRTVQSPHALGLNLDGDETGAASDDTCQHQEFTTPTGVRGIDNQEYRAMGCLLEWRGVDGTRADQQVGVQQFHASGEWTQVILLRGVDSLQNDPDVEVVYANTPDRPVLDTQGKWLRGASFTISDKPPRERNVLHGRIVHGVLTTDPADIKLVQTWGQSAQRDLRGRRAKFDYRKGRLQVTFQSDGSLKGFLAGYRPVFDTIISTALGGAGSSINAGRDCAAELKTLQTMADGLKNPKTGKCEGISGAQQLSAIPAFVTDVPGVRTATR